MSNPDFPAEFKVYTKNGIDNFQTDRICSNSNSWVIASYSDRLEAVSQILNCFVGDTSTLFSEVNLSKLMLNQAADSLNNNFPRNGYSAFTTSGSTGFPKLVIHKNSSLIKAALEIGEVLSLKKGKVWHHMFPSHYMAGVLNCTLVPFLNSGSLFLDEKFTPLSPTQVASSSIEFNASYTWLSPNMVQSIARASRMRRSVKPNWDLVISATGPLSVETRDRFVEATEIEIVNSYGTTEQLFISIERDSGSDLTCGSPLNYVKINPSQQGLIVKSETTAVAVLEWDYEKEIFIPSFLDKENQMLVSDVASYNNNLLRISGRTDNLIVLGGVNISLDEIERVARNYPGVQDACASPGQGVSIQDLVLYLELEMETNFAMDSFKNFLFVQLGNDRAPRRCKVVQLPRTGSGKIDRARVKKLAL